MSVNPITKVVPRLNPALDNFLHHCHSKKYTPRSTIIHAGDESETLYYIIDGSVSVVIEDEDCNEIVLAYLNPGDFFGEMGMFGNGTRTAWVKAKTECEVAELGYNKFVELSQKDAGIMFNVASQLADRLTKTTQKVSDLAFLDVTGRVARQLLDLCNEPDAMTHPDGMQIKITRQELGKIVGCSREMAGRVLKNLEQDGLVSVSGKNMVVFGTR